MGQTSHGCGVGGELFEATRCWDALLPAGADAGVELSLHFSQVPARDGA
jgi:hypothetical protein